MALVRLQQVRRPTAGSAEKARPAHKSISAGQERPFPSLSLHIMSGVAIRTKTCAAMT